MPVCAVVVFYEPDLEEVKGCIASIGSQVDKVFVFDNSADACRDSYGLMENMEYFSFGENLGLSYAQNYLIRKALVEGFEYLVLCDQDTFFPVGFVETMVSRLLSEKDFVLAGIPSWRNLNADNGSSIEGQLIFDRWGRIVLKRNSDFKFFVAHGIASGMVIKSSAFYRVGFFERSFFIDWIDNDWCWRLNARGCKIVCYPDLIMEHKLGSSSKKILNLFKVVERDDFRMYHIIHNGIVIVLSKRYGFFVKLYVLRSVIFQFFSRLILSGDRILTVRVASSAVFRAVMVLKL